MMVDWTARSMVGKRDWRLAAWRVEKMVFSTADKKEQKLVAWMAERRVASMVGLLV